ACVQAAEVISWSARNDGFLALNADTIGSPDGTFAIRDLDGDGVLEIEISRRGISTDPALGPPRSSTTIWDWNGLNYVRATTQLDPPVYRIHLIHDADRAFEAGDYGGALTLYRESLENARLGTWQLENEAVMLRGYTLYRMLLALVVLQDDVAESYYRTLVEENAPGTPGDSYLVMADALWRTWQTSGDLHEACAAVQDAVRLNPQGLLFLNSYGPANRSYDIVEMCPF
ncbi:MAG: hypothetical protein JW910_00135, partial [Anaerolineae bacterium]|nr:hypothetical protein [Anaerolineae bacterium]